MDGNRERRRTRWRGLVGLSITRLWRRSTRTRSGRIVATVCAVALTIALLIVVTGIALALADGGATSADDADVRITPEPSGTLSSVDGVEGPRLGETNERAATIRADERVEHASPVLVEPVKLEGNDGDPQTVLLVGVVPDDDPRTVAGLPTADLEPGDTHYADGSYDGPVAGEIVLSTAAAERLGADAGDEVGVSTPQEGTNAPSPAVTVTAVESAGDRDTGAPVALVHLSELQSVAGAHDGELADRVLVWGDSEAAEPAADAYPAAAIESTDRTNPSSLFGDGLAFATSALALIVGVGICASFVATTAGMTVNEDRRTIAVLASLGVPASGRLLLVALSTLLTTLCGALLGVVLGVVGIQVLNALAGATVVSGTLALVHPLFVPYAVAVALLAALVAVPYPLAIAARTPVLEEVGR